jgi:hypothetical protein
MKLQIAAIVAGLITAEGWSGPTESTVLAAMKLSEQPNYSWVSTVVDDARTYEIEGMTERDGATWVRMPMVIAIARRVGRWAGPDVEAIFRGNETCVLRTARGWQTLRELPKWSRDWNENDDWLFASRSRGAARWALTGGGSSSGLDPASPLARMLQADPPDDDAGPPYCNAQFGVSHPHEELGVIVSCSTALQVDGDNVVGTLSDLGAQLLLVRDGQDNIKPLAAAGSFRLQIKDGMVVKYALRLEGLLMVDDRRVHVHQLSSTAVKNVGTTHFETPEEARRKLGLP